MVVKIFFLLTFLVSSTAGLGQSIAVKNHRQIYQSLATLLSLDPADPTLVEFYKQTKNRLPSTGQVGEVSSPMLLALMNLSGAFCNKFIVGEADLPDGERRIFQGIDLSDNYARIDRIQRLIIADRFGMLFWGRPMTSGEQEGILQAMRYHTEARPLSQAEKFDVLAMGCVSVAASLESYLFRMNKI